MCATDHFPTVLGGASMLVNTCTPIINFDGVGADVCATVS